MDIDQYNSSATICKMSLRWDDILNALVSMRNWEYYLC